MQDNKKNWAGPFFKNLVLFQQQKLRTTGVGFWVWGGLTMGEGWGVDQAKSESGNLTSSD